MLHAFLLQVGRYVLWLCSVFSRPRNLRRYYPVFVQQCTEMGVRMVWIMVVISAFLGMVISLQIVYMVPGIPVPRSLLARLIRDFLLLELSPAGMGVVLASVLGFRMCAELGYLRITEQIDALEVMGVNARSYLVLPRVAACLCMVPCLLVISVTTSLAAGGIAADLLGAIPWQAYVRGLMIDFGMHQLLITGVKTMVFAWLFATVSCYNGYHVQGTALEVNRTATRSVMYSCVLIMAADYAITQWML